jgi:hypothetical protein
MKRPPGVTASAIVAILGSVLALLFAVGAVASLFIETGQPRPANNAPGVIGGAVIFAVLAGVGIWTSVGLFRLRRWARTSILIFATFLAACSVFALLVTMVVPIPPDFGSGTAHTFRQTAAVTFGIPLAIAVWWLIQFNMSSTKAAFSSPIESVAPDRPLTITVLAWTSIVGAAWCLFPLLSRVPLFLFGAIFDGWAAAIIYVLIAALSLYIGKGLLDLRERARVVAIAWFVFGFFHMSLITIVPSWRQRMVEVERSLVPDQQASISFDQGIVMNLMLAAVALVAAAAIWILMRDRYAFVRAENARDWPGLHG